MRLISLTALIVCLTACYDFKGDQQKLGFSSDAMVGAQPWTPSSPLADGARVLIKVGEVLATEESPDHTEFFASNLETWKTESGIGIAGADGRVEATGDGGLLHRAI